MGDVVVLGVLELGPLWREAEDDEEECEFDEWWLLLRFSLFLCCTALEIFTKYLLKFILRRGGGFYSWEFKIELSWEFKLKMSSCVELSL